MPVTEEQVREELMKVIDPELFVNIVDLGLIYVVALEEAEAAAPGEEAAVEETAVEETTKDDASESAAAEPVADEVVAESEASAPPTPSEADPPSNSRGGKVTNVKIEMTMTSPMCPAGPQLVANSKQVVGQIEGVGEVDVKVVMDPPWTPDLMTDEARDKLGIF